MPKMGKLLGLPVISVHTSTPGTYPEIPVLILDKGIHQVVSQALIVSDRVLVNGEGIPVIPVQPLPCPKPHKTPAALYRTNDIAMRQSLGCPQMLKRKII
jgi:hypothetical protein